MTTACLTFDGYPDLLEGHKHGHVPRTESEEVGLKSFVEREWSFFHQNGGYDSDERRRLTWSLVHQASFDHVDGRTERDGVEAGTESANDVREEVVLHADLAESNLLKLIVGRELSGVDDGVSHDVGSPADPESGDAILL